MSGIELDYSRGDKYHCELCGCYNGPCMNSVFAANTVGFLSSFFVLMGIAGVTSQDLTGFVNVVLSLVAVASFVWSHFAHKRVVAAAKVS